MPATSHGHMECRPWIVAPPTGHACHAPRHTVCAPMHACPAHPVCPPTVLGGAAAAEPPPGRTAALGGSEGPQKIHWGGLGHEGHPLSNTLRGAWASPNGQTSLGAALATQMPFAKHENCTCGHARASHATFECPPRTGGGQWQN